MAEEVERSIQVEMMEKADAHKKCMEERDHWKSMALEYQKKFYELAGTRKIRNLTDAKDYLETRLGPCQVLGVLKLPFHREGRQSMGKVAFEMATPLADYCIMTFKRFWFRGFGSQFNRPEKQGQLMNWAIVKEAANVEALFIIVMQNGDVFTCPARRWENYVKDHNTFLIRNRLEESAVPARLLDRWKREGEE